MPKHKKRKNKKEKQKLIKQENEIKDLKDMYRNQAENEIKEKDIFAKVDVLLANIQVKVPVELIVNFSESVLEIKRIKKDVYITEEKLIPIKNENDEISNKGQVFLSGFVRKDIEYTTVSDTGVNYIYGDVKHIVVNSKFDWMSEIEYEINPKYTIIEKEIAEEDKKEICYEEPIVFKIESSNVQEYNVSKNNKPLSKNFPFENTFRTLKEKMFVNINIKLFQKQEIKIN